MTLQRQIDRLVAHQAAQWYETLRLGNERRHPEFVRWVSESPRHMQAFLAIAAEATELRRIFGGKQFDLQVLLSQVGSQVLPMPSMPSTPARAESRRPRRTLVPWFSAAAACAAIAVSAYLWLGSRSQSFETGVGEQRVVLLADGSMLNLNADSHAEVRIGEHTRDIRLPKGEALFRVAPDRTRPFRVHTPNAIVEAVGTQFNVDVRSNSTTVSVLEGKVRILPVGTAPAATSKRASRPPIPVTTALVAGEAAEIASAGAVELHREASISDAVAWQQRKLIFKLAPLEDIVAEFNRYNKNVRLRTEQLPPGKFVFSGAFDADDPISLAELLRREPDLSVHRHGEEIVIRPRSSSAASGATP